MANTIAVNASLLTEVSASMLSATIPTTAPIVYETVSDLSGVATAGAVVTTISEGELVAAMETMAITRKNTDDTSGLPSTVTENMSAAIEDRLDVSSTEATADSDGSNEADGAHDAAYDPAHGTVIEGYSSKSHVDSANALPRTMCAPYFPSHPEVMFKVRIPRGKCKVLVFLY